MVYFLAYETSKTLQVRQQQARARAAHRPPPTAAPLPASLEVVLEPAEAAQHAAQADAQQAPPSSSGSHAPAASTSPSDLARLEKRAGGLSAPRYMLSGMFAAACAVLATQPQDVIKTRLQTQGSLPASEQRYKGIVDAAQQIARQEGPRAFFKGLMPRMLYLLPASALTFSLYECYKRQMAHWLGVDASREWERIPR